MRHKQKHETNLDVIKLLCGKQNEKRNGRELNTRPTGLPNQEKTLVKLTQQEKKDKLWLRLFKPKKFTERMLH